MATGRTDGPFVAANPRAEVPVLVDGSTCIFESTIIMEYIEDRWPEPPLLPRSPEARAFARIKEDVCDYDTQYQATGDFARCCGFAARPASSPKRCAPRRRGKPSCFKTGWPGA
jgi:glutathione S-transferase